MRLAALPPTRVDETEELFILSSRVEKSIKVRGGMTISAFFEIPPDRPATAQFGELLNDLEQQGSSVCKSRFIGAASN